MKPMRVSPGNAANVFAWMLIFGLICAAGVMVVILGPFGLIVLGLMILFVCTQFSLDEEAAGSGTEVFRARMNRGGSLEERAARAEQRQASHAPLRFFRLYGAVLLVAGALGFAWQMWR